MVSTTSGVDTIHCFSLLPGSGRWRMEAAECRYPGSCARTAEGAV